MDTVDTQILRIMGLRPYGQLPQDMNGFKPAYIAKKIGLEPKTVKARIQRLKESGLISFYQLYPNFNHLEVNGSAYLFNVKEQDQKPKIIKRIEMVGELLEVHDFLGKELCVDIGYHTNYDLDKKIGLLREFTGDAKPICFYHRHMPKVNRKLSLLDWRILKTLRYNALQSPATVAAQLKISLKTAKRRIERMGKEGSFFIVPALDPSKAIGLVLFELLVYTNQSVNNSSIQQILQTTKDHYVYHYIPASSALGNFDLILFVDSIGKIEELRQKVSKINGVAKTNALIFQGWHDFTGWIDSAIEQKISSLSKT
ncbi:MAG: hypothetical protein QT03_C0001G1286 [archaeon GW2011_AR10]|uniref:Lrp/AsnC family transcriptional regulator n=1 Tax=Candidatus Iainarchaeum sp. TaxID=3101447 RepID=A0A7J4IWH1_9ARCH|nr:MAG: hypothetical protein QT03_C0001G1286 [archaeon GW2011_AR10]HIH08097.1 Lrp/AsnC family transcriptional regulator [Candidatus Diapherotrites archaeon]